MWFRPQFEIAVYDSDKFGVRRGFNDSLDPVEIEDCSHVLGQRHRIRPHKVIRDWDDVLLAIQGRNDLLRDQSKE